MNILISISYRDYIKKKYVIYSIWDKKLRLKKMITFIESQKINKKISNYFFTKNVKLQKCGKNTFNVSFNFKSKYFDPIDL